MKDVRPEAIIVSLEDGDVFVSSIYHVPEDVIPRLFLFQAIDGLNEQLHLNSGENYILERVDDQTYCFHKID